MATNFATRYKKDLSTETLKVKLVRRKSIIQKESRLNQFNKGRQFGLVDVNTQLSRDQELPCLKETSDVQSPKSKTKTTKTRGQERIEMLQRYKAEKELRKLKDQREKPVFKCGRYKPEIPSFLPPVSQIPVLSKPKEKVAAQVAAAPALSVRVTRSKAKDRLEERIKPSARPHLLVAAPNYISKGSGLQSAQHTHKQIYVDKPPKKEKVVQPSVLTATNGRITRATAAAQTKIPQASQLATIAGNLPQKRATNKRKHQKEVKNERGMELHGIKENTLEPVKKGDQSQIQPAVDIEQDEAFLQKENMPSSHIPASAPPKRTRSFAPQNFLFKPLEGLATYKVTPMSPSRANVFLSPDLSWNPTKVTSEDTEEGAKKAEPQDCDVVSPSFPNTEIFKEGLHESQSAPSPAEDKTECVSHQMIDAVSCELETIQQFTDLPVTQASDPAEDPQHDVPYFRNILQSETERLTSHCLEWDGTTETNIPEDAKDLVRTTVGQTRLLIAERFKQFEGLVDNCEFRRGEKETTCTDLDGFWDMVNFQVEDVNKKFENLRKLQQNGWQMPDCVQTKRPAKKKTSSQRATKVRGGSAEKTAARKRLASIKAVMKNKMKQEGMATEAAGPEMPQEVEKVTFDGGFFQIESPAKFLPGLTPKSADRTSRRISRQVTPRSVSRAWIQSCTAICVARLGTPVTSSTITPLQDLDACLDPAGGDLLGCISEQSDFQAAEGPCAMTEDAAGETNEAQTATSDGCSPTSGMNGFVSDHSQVLEHPSIEMEIPDVAEEATQVVADLNKQNVLCIPEKSTQPERTSVQCEELHTSECRTGFLLGDFSCDDVPLNFAPNPDCSHLFTPPRNEAEKFSASALCNNLIVFSPLPLLDGKK